MGLHISCRISWEFLQKVLEFSDTQKMPFQTINCFNLQQEISKNYPGCSKISLKIRVAFFILLKISNKFQDIPIARNTQIDEIFQKSTKLKVTMEFDQHFKSIQNQNEVEVRSFLTPSYPLKTLG